MENSGPAELEEEKKSAWKIKALILIFILGLGALAFFKFYPSFFPQSTAEKSQGGILDILSSEGLGVGDLAPDFASEDVYGDKISLSDFQGKKPVLLVFWATWCDFCAKELEDLKDFTAEHQKEIQVMAISSGESKEIIEDYIQEENVNFLMVLDEKREIWNQYLVRGTPSHFLISNQREIVTLRPGLASRGDLEIMTTMLTELW